MKYLVDTDYAISYLKGKKEVVELLIRHQGELGMSVISLAEILEGIYGQPNEKDRRSDFRGFLTGVNLLNVDENIAENFARIRAELREKRALLESLDILIASTAEAHNLILVTGNKKHFERVEGLKIL